MTVRPSATAPNGFLVYRHAGDDYRPCRDYVRKALGIDFEAPRKKRRPSVIEPPAPPNAAQHDRCGLALDLWSASVDPRGTLVERYFERERGLVLGDDVAGRTLRWNDRIGAMIALFRNITTGEPQAVSRTFLTPDARNIERKFFGPVGGAAVMIDPFDAVTSGLHIGQGTRPASPPGHSASARDGRPGSAARSLSSRSLPASNLTEPAEHDAASARAVNTALVAEFVFNSHARLFFVDMSLRGPGRAYRPFAFGRATRRIVEGVMAAFGPLSRSCAASLEARRRRCAPFLPAHNADGALPNWQRQERDRKAKGGHHALDDAPRCPAERERPRRPSHGPRRDMLDKQIGRET